MEQDVSATRSIFNEQSTDVYDAHPLCKQPKDELLAVSWFEKPDFLGAVFYRQDPDVGLLAFFNIEVQGHVASTEVENSKSHVAGLLQDKFSVLVLSLLDFNLEAIGRVNAVFEGTDLEDACVA